MVEKMKKRLTTINAAPKTVPVQVEELEGPTPPSLKVDTEGVEETAPTAGSLIKKEETPTILSEDSPYYPIIRELKESDFKDFTNKNYGILDPYKMKRSQRTVVGIGRIHQELESAGIFIARRPNGNLMTYVEGYWKVMDEEGLKSFLAEAMIALGFKREDMAHYTIKEELYKQLVDISPVLKSPAREEILINLANGTIEISADDKVIFRECGREDYLTYQLPFNYDADSTCPIFQDFLDEVLPEKESQAALGEFFGSAFIDNKRLKLEKALLLYGTGNNGKSVVFEVMQSLFGEENFSTYSLESITDTSGYSRAQLDGKLLNYASEISGPVSTARFKQLVSGESIEVRNPYQPPYLMDRIPKLAFNINEFPKNSENTDAFYRRLLIIPFKIRIPAAKQDKTLARRITESELSGVFNWVLAGMSRLKKRKAFTDSPAAAQLLEDFKLESDIVASFLDEKEITPSDDGHTISLKALHDQFSAYCTDCRVRSLSRQDLRKRLGQIGFESKKTKTGIVVYAKREVTESEIAKKYQYNI